LTTAAAARNRPAWQELLFDPEKVGEAMVGTLSGVEPVSDFQDWHPWRELVVAA
jgi:hypothetical protein